MHATGFLPLRLHPGEDLRGALEDRARPELGGGAFVVCGIGSLERARLRYAGAEQETELPSPLEILSLSGSLSGDGAHLHMSVADARGRVHVGHVGRGNPVRTTVELLLAPLPGWVLGRVQDPVTGYPELVMRKGPGLA